MEKNVIKPDLELVPALQSVNRLCAVFEDAVSMIPSGHMLTQEGTSLLEIHHDCAIAASDVVKHLVKYSLGRSTCKLYDIVLSGKRVIEERPIRAYQFLVNMNHLHPTVLADSKVAVDPKVLFTFPVIWDPNAAFVIKQKMAPVVEIVSQGGPDA